MVIIMHDYCSNIEAFRHFMIWRVHMPEYNPSPLGGLNWEGGSFAQSQYPTVVYMTFFPNDEIRKFFPGFDSTLSVQYHELKLINVVPSYTMPWQNINNLTKYCVVIVRG